VGTSINKEGNNGVGKREQHGRKLKLKETGHEKGHVALRIK
jgi:hypothetical protein